MSKEDIFILLGIIGFIGLFFLVIVFGLWSGTEIENETFIEFLQGSVSKIVSDIKYTFSRLY